MKCRNCGAELTEGALFCRECGSKNEPQKRFCRECGKEVSLNAHFCSYCGADLTTIPSPEQLSPDGENDPCDAPSSKVNESPFHYVSPNLDASTIVHSKIATILDGIRLKLKTFWEELDPFSKTFVISTAIVLLLLLVAFASHSAIAIFFSLFQVAGLVLAMLMHKGVLSSPKEWLKYALLAAVLLFSVLNIMSYSWLKKGTVEKTGNTISENETIEATVFPPYSAVDCIGKNYDTLKNDFLAAGFTDIRTEATEDLSYSESYRVGSVESVSIGEVCNFAKVQQFGKNEIVNINYHAYKKVSVNIDIDFLSNFFFDKYGVSIYLNNEKIGELAHGEDKSFSLEVEPGTYTLLLQKKGNTSCTGSFELDVKGDVNTSIQISCQSDSILIKPLYIEKLGEIQEGEIMMPQAASAYKYKDYIEVRNALENMGFSNISTTPLYDIVWGLTSEGTTESVSIDGNTSYARGDIFSSDAPVIITYHMKEINDPERPTETTQPPEAETVKTYSIDDDLVVIRCERDEKYQTMYHIAFAQVDSNGNHIHEYSFGHCVNPRTMGTQFNAIGNLPSWFYVGATVHVKANLGYDGLSETDTMVTEATGTNNTVSSNKSNSAVILPDPLSKLGKDFDSKTSSTVYYLNVDGTNNTPAIKSWKGATVTDGVAEYLDKLESDGFNIRITDQSSATPYSGFTYYDTYFEVSSSGITWTMYLNIESEKYIEYELDIYLN